MYPHVESTMLMSPRPEVSVTYTARVYIPRRPMRPANPRLVIARAAALGFAALGCWSIVACAKTPSAGTPAEAATVPAKAADAAPSLPPDVKPLYDKLDDLGKKVFNRVATSES